MYEEDDLNYDDTGTPPEESSNRTFLIAAGILGGIVLLSLICLVGVFVYQSSIATQQKAEQDALATQNAQVNEALTATAVVFELSLTPQASPTPFPTDTPVVALPTDTDTPLASLTPDPATATVAAGLTQVAELTMTVFPTSTSLPDSGFADNVGLPGLLIAAITLVVVIILARRLRAAPTR
jgi:hypothetical protein